MERKQTAQCCVIPERRETRAVSPVTAMPFCQGVCRPEPPGGVKWVMPRAQVCLGGGHRERWRPLQVELPSFRRSHLGTQPSLAPGERRGGSRLALKELRRKPGKEQAKLRGP